MERLMTSPGGTHRLGTGAPWSSPACRELVCVAKLCPPTSFLSHTGRGGDVPRAEGTPQSLARAADPSPTPAPGVTWEARAILKRQHLQSREIREDVVGRDIVLLFTRHVWDRKVTVTALTITPLFRDLASEELREERWKCRWQPSREGGRCSLVGNGVWGERPAGLCGASDRPAGPVSWSRVRSPLLVAGTGS